MIVSDFANKTYLLATGKAATLDATNSKYTKILALGNIFQPQWAREPGVDWQSLYSRRLSIGTVTATGTFTIPSTVLSLSKKEGDPVVIVDTSGNETLYTIVSPDELEKYRYSNVCAKKGSSLIFPEAFTSASPQFGGTIYAPAYADVTALVNATDVIAVDDPMWLCFMCAAQYDSDEIDKQNKPAGLISLAANSMDKMKESNGGQINEVPMYATVVGDET